jgi:hypothetical protein
MGRQTEAVAAYARDRDVEHRKRRRRPSALRRTFYRFYNEYADVMLAATANERAAPRRAIGSAPLDGCAC